MSTERRYDEEEIAEIFKRAAVNQEAAHRRLWHAGGLTLAELQQIGSEAGIAPEFIARAAATLDQSIRILPARTYFGLPITVGRVIDLPGPLSDEEWDRLVVDLRETFQASGKIRRDGAFRQWKNGNLEVLVEPAETGHRLRLRTLNGNARSALMAGQIFVLMGLAFMLVASLSGKFGMNSDTLLLALIGVAGLGSLGYAVHRLPKWVQERGRQMEAVINRTLERMALPLSSRLSERSSSGLLDIDDEADAGEKGQARLQNKTRG